MLNSSWRNIICGVRYCLQWGIKTSLSLELILKFSCSFTKVFLWVVFFFSHLYNHNSASPFWNNCTFLSPPIYHFRKQYGCLLPLLSLTQIGYKCLRILDRI